MKLIKIILISLACSLAMTACGSKKRQIGKTEATPPPEATARPSDDDATASTGQRDEEDNTAQSNTIPGLDWDGLSDEGSATYSIKL